VHGGPYGQPLGVVVALVVALVPGAGAAGARAAGPVVSILDDSLEPA
jgi:hypothetical protein